MKTGGSGLTKGGRLALIVATVGLLGVGGASFAQVGQGTTALDAQKTYPKVSATVIATRRASGSSYGGSRYGTSRRSYGGGGYSGGK